MSTEEKVSLLKAKRLIDGTGTPVRDDAAVLIKDGVIAEIGHRDEIVAPPRTEVIDLGERTIMPGMVDAHMHFFGVPSDKLHQLPTEPEAYRVLRAAGEAKKMLEAGITATRCLGSSISPYLRRAINEGHVPGKNFIQVGLRGYYPDEETFDWMRKNELRYHTMAEVERRGWPAVMEDIIREAKDGPEYLFISFDIDTLDPAFVPGTGTPEPGGLTPREAFPIVRRLCAESNVVGFELVELLPYRVPGYETVLNSERIVRECLVGIAMRKKGIEEKHYLAPLTADDSRS